VRESLHFSYRGIHSVDMGLLNVNIGDGMLEEPFVASREIKEIKIRGRHKPYFQGIELYPLSFPVSFAFKERFNEKKIREVARWLTPNYYESFYTVNNPNKIWFCLPVEDFMIIHNGLKQGYVQLTMRCDSPYTYSQQILSPVYDFSNNTSLGTFFIFDNLGDVELKPEMWITKIGDGDISIVNITDGNKEFKFVNLVDNEVIYVNNKKEIIKTDISMTYRYDNFNDNYLKFVFGKNNLIAYGDFKMNLRYRFVIL